MMQNQETYAAFIDLEKAFGKIWSGATFYLLWKRGNGGKLCQKLWKTTLRPGIWTTDR